MNNLTKQEIATIELWGNVADDLNAVIVENGYIDINNHAIWNRYLHAWNNDTWIDLLEILYTVHTTTFEAELKPFQRDAVFDALTALNRYGFSSPRILDTKKYKVVAWRCLMILREHWNHIQGVNIPNRVPAKSLADA